MSDFIEFPSIARLSREMIVTEKIDGTNAQIHVAEDGVVRAGSRNRWITPEQDNFGFAAWVKAHEEELRAALGPGAHYGEWWGSGVQRGYGLSKGEKRFSLFNVGRWVPEPEPIHEKQSRPPLCCAVVPILYRGPFDTATVDTLLASLKETGSRASPGFMQPEGVVVFHVQGRHLFKKTLDKNDGHKGGV